MHYFFLTSLCLFECKDRSPDLETCSGVQQFDKRSE